MQQAYSIDSSCAERNGEISYEHHPRLHFDSSALDFILFECHVCHITRERAVTQRSSSHRIECASYIAFKCFYFISFFVHLHSRRRAQQWRLTEVLSHAREFTFASHFARRFVTYTRNGKVTENDGSHLHYTNEITYKRCEQRIMQITVKYFSYRI